MASAGAAATVAAGTALKAFGGGKQADDAAGEQGGHVFQSVLVLQRCVKYRLRRRSECRLDSNQIDIIIMCKGPLPKKTRW